MLPVASRRLRLALSLSTLLAAAAHAGPIEERLTGALRDLDPAELTTGVLHDRVLSLAGLERFAGAPGGPAASARLWGQIYEELRRSAADPSARPPLAAVRERARRRDGAIPLALVLDRYERIRPDALASGALAVRDGRLTRGPGPAFEVRTAFAAAALKGETWRGGEVAFVLERDAWFSRHAPLPALTIDLDDGLGFRPLRFGVPVAARYAAPGGRSLRVRATTADGEMLEAAASFVVRALAAPTPDDTLAITGTIPWQSGVASGEAYVYLAPGRTAIVNPVVVVEGFDLDNTMNWDELYALLNQESLIETLRAGGFDAVVLNFTDATDYLQRNAFVVVELLQQLQATLPPSHSVALIGASMGGLVGRYALAWMEQQAIPHDVRTFVSFDAPHLGANIPLGIQYWVKFFAGQSADAAFLLSRLDRPAACQMLLYHYTDPPGTTGVPDPLRAAFLAELAALGDFPAQPHTVAVANGSGTAAGQGFAPGAQLIDWDYSSFLVAIRGDVWAVNDGPSSAIFEGRLRVLLSETSQTVTAAGTQPYDNAPGGWRATMTQMDTTAAPYGDILAVHPAHCFIPTVSALAFTGGGLFHDLAADPDPLAATPFDAIHFPAANQEHVAITAGNAAWLRAAIEDGVVGVAPGGAAIPRLDVAPNPAGGPVRIGFTLPGAGAADLRVFGVDGREIARLARGPRPAGAHQALWTGADASGVPVPAGVYFVRLALNGAVAVRRVVRLR